MDILINELNTDPLELGYSGMTATQVVASINADTRQRNKSHLTGSEILNAVNKTEFNALSVSNKQLIWDLLHLGVLNPFGIEATLFTDAFGAQSTTITNLASIRKEQISRAEELNITPRPVKVGHVLTARQ